MRLHRRAIICAIGLAPLAAAGGCNALIGLDDLPSEATDAATMPDASGGDGDDASVHLDGSTTERDATLGSDGGDDGDGESDAQTVDGGDRVDAGSCVRDPLQNDAGNCGGCGACVPPGDAEAACVEGMCGYTGSPASLAGYRIVNPAPTKNLDWQDPVVDDAERVLVVGLFPGRVIADNEAGAWWISADGGVQAVPPVGPFNSVYLGAPVAAVLSPIESQGAEVESEAFDGSLSRVNCSFVLETATRFVSVDADGGFAYVFDTAANLYSFQLSPSLVCGDLGSNPGETSSASQLYISAPSYGFSVGASTVAGWKLASSGPAVAMTYSSPSNGANGLGAVTAAGSLVYAFDRGAMTGESELALIAPNASAPTWRLDNTTAAVSFQGIVITSNHVIIVAETEGGLASIRAYDELVDADAGSDGGVPSPELAWSFVTPVASVSGTFGPMALGDDGMLWVATTGGSGQNHIYGLDSRTGAQIDDLTDQSWTSPFTDLILANGHLYATVQTNVGVIVIPVSSHGYDTSSPWPVFGHDNQRTFNVNSPLNH